MAVLFRSSAEFAAPLQSGRHSRQEETTLKTERKHTNEILSKQSFIIIITLATVHLYKVE